MRRLTDSQPKNVLDASKIWHAGGTQYSGPGLASCLSVIQWREMKSRLESGSLLTRELSFHIYLKYALGVTPKAFLNMEVKALGVL